MTSPSGAVEERATDSKLQQQQQEGSPTGCSPPRLQRSRTGADPCSAVSSLNDENRRQLEGEGSDRRPDRCATLAGEGRNHLGSSLSTNGAAWRNTKGSGTPQDVGNSGSLRSGAMCESPGRRDAAERAAAVDRSDETNATGVNGSTSRSSATEGEKRKGDKRSSSPSPRTLEYLFFTGRRGGTAGMDRSAGGREPRSAGDFRGNTTSGSASAGDGNAYESWQPDLLKLAEDGFRLPYWSETETDNTTSEGMAGVAKPSASEAGRASHTSFDPTSIGDNTTVAAPDRGGGEEGYEPPRPQSIVLSTHLSKTDIPGMNGDAALAAAAQASKVNSSSVAPPASIGLGNREFVSPVCRVLVVKVYTGRTYRTPCGSPSEGDSGVGAAWGRDSSGSNVCRVPRPSVLREAWATGFKAVCVSENDEVSEGGERGDGSGDGAHCLNNPSSRYQVSVGLCPMYLLHSDHRQGNQLVVRSAVISACSTVHWLGWRLSIKPYDE